MTLAENLESTAVTAPRRRRGVTAVEVPLGIAFVALTLTFSVLYPHTFPDWSNVVDMARVGAILLVVALGQMMALLVGGFDLSVAANMGFASTVCALVMINDGVVAGVCAGIGVAMAMGIVNGLLISYLNISPFVATLGTLTFVTGLGNQLSGGTSVAPLPASFNWLGARNWGPIPATVCIAAIVVLVLATVLGRTRFGLYLYSIGSSRQASLLAGVPVRPYLVAAYGACGLLAGVAGLMLSSRISVGQSGLGVGYDLMSIATAVIGGVAIGGGTGRIRGVVLGVAILAVLTTGLDIAGVSQFTQSMVTGVVLVVAVAADLLRRRV